MLTTLAGDLADLERLDDEFSVDAPDASAVLSCRGLAKWFGHEPAVAGVGFDIAAGEALALVGGPGSGKTSIVRMVCGILEPDEGVILVQGRDIETLSGREAAESVGYVPESGSALPSLTLAENLGFWARLYGVPRRLRQERVDAALAAVDLVRRRDAPVAQCSKGSQRRLSLAVALLQRPRLLVLDDPTAGIDPESETRIFEALAQLRAEGAAVLVATRQPEVATRLGGRASYLVAGRQTS